MDALHRGMSVLVVLGVLLVGTLFWAATNERYAESSEAMAVHANTQAPAVIPAPVAQRTLVLHANSADHEPVAPHAQPLPIPAPEHSK